MQMKCHHTFFLQVSHFAVKPSSKSVRFNFMFDGLAVEIYSTICSDGACFLKVKTCAKSLL